MSYKVERNSSIELLRIVCMIFIVMHHIIITTIAPQFSSSFYNFLDFIFHTAVVIFIIISGYFGIHFKLNKFLKLWAQVLYYSITIGLISYLLLNSISLKSLIASAFPIYMRPYWFVSSYIELFLFSPILNIVVRYATRAQLLLAIIILLIINWAFPIDLISTTGLTVFSMLYFIGRYMFLYKRESYQNNKIITFNIAGYLLLLFSLCYLLTPESRLFNLFLSFTYRYYSIGTIYLSLLIFIFFRNITYHSHIVNYISASVFAIYLIHENPHISKYMYVEPTLWCNSIGLPSYVSMLVVTVVLCGGCILIDQLRIALFKQLNPLFAYLEQKATNFYQELVDRINVKEC